MYILQKNRCRFYPKLLLVLSSACFCLSLAVDVADAQETVLPAPTSSDRIVGQSPTPPTTSNQPVRRRLRTTFFEEETRVGRFGVGNFLQSALDGAQNALADPAKISNFGENPSNPSISLFGRPQDNPNDISGELTVFNDGSNNGGVTSITFNNQQNTNVTFGGLPQNLQFDSIEDVAEVRTGTLTIQNGSTVVTPNGTRIPLSGIRNYNLGYSENGNNTSAVLLITDPENPSQSIFIQVPPVSGRRFSDLGQQDNVRQPANLSIGLPSDR